MKTIVRMCLALAVILLPAGCPQDFILSGTVTFPDQPSEAGDCYVYLDNDTDITNGYAARTILPYTLPVAPIMYTLDTSAVAAGTYYLLGGGDFGAGNMDPLTPPVWEYKGWYGSGTYSPPAAANVTNLSGAYTIALYGLP
jgi:hypothetical protein